MAGLFAIVLLAMIAIFIKSRALGMGLIFLSLVLGLLMFWHHATDILNINW